MDIELLKEDLIADEGIKYEIYLDSEGHATFGIGHLIKKQDREYGMLVGTRISEERVYEAFDNDIDVVLRNCESNYDNFYDLPEECQLILANMMFNMGLTRMRKFVDLREAINNNDWQWAADEMIDSLWHRKLHDRSSRLIERMQLINE